MKNPNVILCFMAALALSLLMYEADGQSKFPVLTAKDIQAEFAKYPTRKSDLCPACRLWVNPYYSSIADTVRHMPLLEHYVYTKQHRLMQQALGTGNRKGPESEWHHVTAARDVTAVYSAANRIINRPDSPYEIAYGHCGAAWVLLAWCQWGMVYSDVYDYNAAMQYQGQNVGTEIATEDRCRMLTGWSRSGEIIAVTARIDIWAGTWVDPAKYAKDAKVKPTTYTDGRNTVTVPDVYWKVMVYRDSSNALHVECFWMPNLPTETKDLVAARIRTYDYIVQQLGFDPIKQMPTTL